MDNKDRFQQLREILPKIEEYHRQQKICYKQHEFIAQLTQMIDPAHPPEDVVKDKVGIQVASLWQLTKSQGYEVIQTLQKYLDFMC